MLLPGLVLAVFPIALIARTTRDSVLGVLAEPYITASVANGGSAWQVFSKHVVRNAVAPVLTIAVANVGYLLGGALIVERVFSVPGVGQYVVAAIQTRDYAVVQSMVMLGAAIFVILNALLDIAYPLVNPRLAQRTA
jgi:peptide/nickel transport system permease protein